MDQVKVGEFIRKKRTEKGLTQEQLAENLNISQRTVSLWENGSNMPDISLIHTLAEELNVTAGELLTGGEIKDPEPVLKTENRKTPGALTESPGQERENSRSERIKKARMILTVLLIVLMPVLMDVSIGFFSTSLYWVTNEKMFRSHGIIFGLIYGQQIIIDIEGLSLRRMFVGFLFLLILVFVVIMSLLMLNLAESKMAEKRLHPGGERNETGK